MTCERIETKEDRFLLYNESDQESTDGFLSFEDIAAIIPEKYWAQDPKLNAPSFEVYLRGRSDPLKIIAHAFKREGESSRERFVFFVQKLFNHHVEAEFPLDEIYVAVSEVIARIPSCGLFGR